MILNNNNSARIISAIEKITQSKCPWQVTLIEDWCDKAVSSIIEKKFLQLREGKLTEGKTKKLKIDSCNVNRKTPVWIGEPSKFFGTETRENKTVIQKSPEFYFYQCKGIYIYQFYEFGPIVFNERFEIIKELSTPYYKLLILDDNVINEKIVKVIDKPTCAISDRFLENNYAHWLLDTIPRIKGYELLNTHIDETSFLINPIKSKWQKDMLTAYNIKNHTSLTKNVLTKFSNIVLPQDFGSIVPHPALKANPETLKRLCTINYNKIEKKSDILIIRRKGSRELTNLDELITSLEKFGYSIETIDPSNITFNSQASYFKDYKFIISVHGAALANTVFMNKGAYLFEIMPQNYGNPAFWLLSSTKEVNYYCITDVSNDLSDDRNRNRNKNLYISKKSIQEIIKICLSA